MGERGAADGSATTFVQASRLEAQRIPSCMASALSSEIRAKKKANNRQQSNNIKLNLLSSFKDQRHAQRTRIL